MSQKEVVPNLVQFPEQTAGGVGAACMADNCHKKTTAAADANRTTTTTAMMVKLEAAAASGVHHDDSSASASALNSNSSSCVDSMTKEGGSNLSSMHLLEDYASPTSSSSPNGPLYQLSELITQLPIKRGLSKYYDGKSQSFTSLASVTCLQHLAKKENPYNRRMKFCRSYNGLNDGQNNNYHHQQHHSQRFCTPKPTIIKKAPSSRTSCFSAMAAVSRSGDKFSNGTRPPTLPLQRQN